MTPIEVMRALLATTTAREAAELATLNSLLQTASESPEPAFAKAAHHAAANLIATRAEIAGLNTLIADIEAEA